MLGTAGVDGTGISNMVRVLAQRLDPAEFSLAACFLGAGGPWLARLHAAGVAAVAVPWSRPRDVAGALRFWRFLRSQRVDVLHVHYGGRSVRRLARFATGAALVVHAHGRVRHEGDYRPIPLKLTDADAVIATSRAVAEVVQARNVRVVYPGVPACGATAERDPWTVGAAGRLVSIKGCDRLIAAFARLRALHPRAMLEIAGDGSSRYDLERQAEHLGLGDAVRFLGWVDDLTPLMARWSVFVQPSLEEALGITVLQAMASGLPVVASDVGGMPELIENGVTGVLVPAGNVPALASAIDDLLRNPGRRAAVGTAACLRAAWFSEGRFKDGVAAVYRGLPLPATRRRQPRPR